jgi:serine phosphatase RsbU (regulator of sigma subunit)
MADGVPALQRLVSKQAVEDLFISFAPLLSGNPAAVLSANGTVFYRSGPAGHDVGIEPTQSYENAGGSETQVSGQWIRLPFTIDDQIYGYLTGKEASDALNALHTSLRQLISTGVDKRRLARETLDRYREVNLLYRVAEIISGTLDIEEILKIILGEAVRAIPVYYAAAVIDRPLSSRGNQVVTLGDDKAAQEIQMLLPVLSQEQDLTYGPKILEDPAYWNGSILYLPLAARGVHLGLIALARKTGDAPFQSGEEKLLVALASQAGFAIDKALLHTRELQRQKVEQELQIGERIQRSLLPREMPAIAGWEFASVYQSANQVGGDFFDVYELPRLQNDERSLAVMVADVTGKGIPAALMMAFSQAIFRAMTSMHRHAGEILARGNQQIFQHSRSGLLLTVFYAILLPESGQVRFANAGHEPPFWFRADQQASFEVDCGSGLLVGARRNTQFPENCITLAPGDALIFYTDGVTEARNPLGDFFSSERLRDIIALSGQRTANELLNVIVSEIKQFTQDEPQADDITVLVIKRLG